MHAAYTPLDKLREIQKKALIDLNGDMPKLLDNRRKAARSRFTAVLGAGLWNS